MTRQIILYRLKQVRIQNQGNSSPGINESVSCILQSLVIKNRSTIVSKKKKKPIMQPCFYIDSQVEFSEKKSCWVFGAINLVSYIISCSHEAINGDFEAVNEIGLSAQGKKYPQPLTIQLFSCINQTLLIPMITSDLSDMSCLNSI